MYTIQIEYETGDSFHIEILTDIVGHVWKLLDKAKESLNRIKSHYEYYQKYGNYNEPEDKMPIGVGYDKEYHILQLLLVNDDDKEVIIDSFWCGYFERLIEAKIILSEDNNMNYIP